MFNDRVNGLRGQTDASTVPSTSEDSGQSDSVALADYKLTESYEVHDVHKDDCCR